MLKMALFTAAVQLTQPAAVCGPQTKPIFGFVQSITQTQQAATFLWDTFSTTVDGVTLEVKNVVMNVPNRYETVVKIGRHLTYRLAQDTLPPWRVHEWIVVITEGCGTELGSKTLGTLTNLSGIRVHVLRK